MIQPRPMPPYPPLYTDSEWPVVQARYEQAEREWQRETSRTMWLNAIPVLCAVVGLVVAALMVPSIVVDALQVLAR